MLKDGDLQNSPNTWNHEQHEGCRGEHPCDIAGLVAGCQCTAQEDWDEHTRCNSYIVEDVQIVEERVSTGGRIVGVDLERHVRQAAGVVRHCYCVEREEKIGEGGGGRR